MYSRVHPGFLDHLRQLLGNYLRIPVPLCIGTSVTWCHWTPRTESQPQNLVCVGLEVWSGTAEPNGLRLLSSCCTVTLWSDVLHCRSWWKHHSTSSSWRLTLFLGGWAGRGFWHCAKTDSCFPFFSLQHFKKQFFWRSTLKEKSWGCSENFGKSSARFHSELQWGKNFYTNNDVQQRKIPCLLPPKPPNTGKASFSSLCTLRH